MATTQVLQSPGLSITVSDESQYVTAGTGSVPLLLMATATNKTAPSGALASGTTAVNAGKLQVFGSQRELISAMGYPNFYTSAGTSLHGDERNEYGLQTAYSALGLGSRVYAIRADIDLAQLTSTSVRPKGTVDNGTLWLDLANTSFGVFQWNADTQTYSAVTPSVVTDSANLGTDSLNTPKDSYGQVGSYAAVVYNANNPLFYRTSNNSASWVALGTMDWQKAWPTVKSVYATYAGNEVPDGKTLTINGQSITLLATDNVTCTSSDVVNSINFGLGSDYANGVRAEIDLNGRLILRATSDAMSNGSLADGKVLISPGEGATLLGLTAGTYYAPLLSFGTYTQVPTFGSGDATPAPTGSIWIKTSSTGGGASWSVNRYSSTSLQFVKVASPVYGSREEAIFALDPLNGGIGISDGTIFVQYSTVAGYPATFKIYERMGAGLTKSTGSVPGASFTVGQTFALAVTEPGSSAVTIYGDVGSSNFTIGATTVDGFVSQILTRNIPNVYAIKESSGAISFVHRSGGDIILLDTTAGTGNPITTAGFSFNTTGVYLETSGEYAGSNNETSLRVTKWRPLGSDIIFSTEVPYVAPADGTLWYYGIPVEADILICSSNGWKGYRNLGSDARGYDLTLTDPLGPIFSYSAPKAQSNGNSVTPGDLWVDLSDLENFPKISRYNGATWTLLDKTDRITQNGLVFADARWDATIDGIGTSIGGIIDPIAGDLPMISDMLVSDYIDLDCPDYRLYPRGTLLWNTRRNGGNVKQFVMDKFNTVAYPSASVDPNDHRVGYIPRYTSTWSNASGSDSSGAPYHGHKAQRQMVVKSLRAALDSNSTIREEQYQFNLIVCPGYPELISNMVSLNEDRNETAFVIGDTPMGLTTSSTDLTTWSNTQEVTGSVMVGVYYPSGLSSEPAQGNEIAVPPSHMALRTFIHNDNISYPWFAPAGSRRGLVDNATAVGYVDYSTGNFVKIGVNQSLRDTLYNLRINPIANLPGSGLTIFGNKTRSSIAQAQDRVNVSRLVNFVRTTLATISNSFLFEPNDKSTRDQIKAAIEGALNDLVSKRGIYDYSVVCDSSNNTSDRIARNELYVDVAIEPMKDVEFIYIPIKLKNPGTLANLGK